jgi:hypothetical protein
VRVLWSTKYGLPSGVVRISNAEMTELEEKIKKWKEVIEMSKMLHTPSSRQWASVGV